MSYNRGSSVDNGKLALSIKRMINDAKQVLSELDGQQENKYARPQARQDSNFAKSQQRHVRRIILDTLSTDPNLTALQIHQTGKIRCAIQELQCEIGLMKVGGLVDSAADGTGAEMYRLTEAGKNAVVVKHDKFQVRKLPMSIFQHYGSNADDITMTVFLTSGEGDGLPTIEIEKDGITDLWKCNTKFHCAADALPNQILNVYLQGNRVNKIQEAVFYKDGSTEIETVEVSFGSSYDIWEWQKAPQQKQTAYASAHPQQEFKAWTKVRFGPENKPIHAFDEPCYKIDPRNTQAYKSMPWSLLEENLESEEIEEVEEVNEKQGVEGS